MAGWPENPQYIGKAFPRLDGPAKVSGAAKYASDVQPDGWLYGMILRSRWPAAQITSVSVEKARSSPGIRAAIAVKGGGAVRYYGEELAAVAGVSKQACLDALQLVEVSATPMPFVVDLPRAINPGAPEVFPGSSNISKIKEGKDGSVEDAFNAPDAVVATGYFSTQCQLHQPLETHGNTVSVTPDGVTCWASTQGIFSVRDGLADHLKLPQNQVQVLCDYMGGGFGSKFGPGAEGGIAARLSQAAGAPVKLMLTRFDESLAVGNRPPTWQAIRLSATKDGQITGYELRSFATSGFASGAASAGGGGGAGFPAPYIYNVPAKQTRQVTAAINAGSSRAFRAPGCPPASFGMESIMDALAVKLGMDPLDFRIKNDPDPVRQEQYRIAGDRFQWKEKYRPPGSSPGAVKTGIGCASSKWGGGGKGSKAEVTINPDGSVTVRCGTQDIGSGSRTIIAVIAGEIFGVDPETIDSRIGNTSFPPSGGSGGSSTAASVSPAIYDACTKARTALEQASGMPDVRGDNWKKACSKLGINPLVATGEWQEGLSSSGTGGVHMAEVSVDTETGFVKVNKVLCVQDCGLVLDKLTCESQINGGVIIGLGYALYEERVMDNQTGVVLNPNFENYKLAGAADIPEIEVILMNMPQRGVIGIGEPSTIPAASAIANAVANAIGMRVPSLPMTPARVLQALGKTPLAPPSIDPKMFDWFDSQPVQPSTS